MAGASQAFVVLALAAVAFFVLPSHSADPDPLQDICVADLSSNITINGFPCKHPATATTEDFIFHLGNRANGTGPYGVIAVVGDVNKFPGVNTQGLTIARLDFDVGGIIPPHTHPLASELVYVEEGSLYAGFVTQDNRLFAQVLNKGDVIIVPRAHIHWQMNVGNTTAKAIVTLNSQSPGTHFIGRTMFDSGIRDDVLAKTFFLDEALVRQIKRGFSARFGA